MRNKESEKKSQIPLAVSITHRKPMTKGSNFSHGNTSTRSSIQMLPIISGLVEKQGAEIEYGALQEGSLSSSNSINKFWLGTDNHKEDLYFWMAKHQDMKRREYGGGGVGGLGGIGGDSDGGILIGGGGGGIGIGVGGFNEDKYYRRSTANKIPTTTSAGVGIGFGAQQQLPHTRQSIMHDSIKLLDAHLIFEPLLTCLGVMPQQMLNKYTNADISSLENFGTNLSLIGTFDSIRVDIVVSEAGDKKIKIPVTINSTTGSTTAAASCSTSNTATAPSASKLSGKKSNGGRPSILMDTPLFLCERVGIELEVLKMSDGMVDHARQNVIYMSRRQLKKHTSTVINFSLNIRFISQQVSDSSLLLLIPGD